MFDDKYAEYPIDIQKDFDEGFIIEVTVKTKTPEGSVLTEDTGAIKTGLLPHNAYACLDKYGRSFGALIAEMVKEHLIKIRNLLK